MGRSGCMAALLSLFVCACVFGGGTGGTGSENNAETNNSNNTAPTNNDTTQCGQTVCSPSQCGETITDPCGNSIVCPDCDCLPEVICPADTCGLFQKDGCDPVDCTPPVEALCAAIEPPAGVTAPPCGEWTESTCDSVVDCGPCDDGTVCTMLSNEGFCCTPAATICAENGDVSGSYDAGDGCGVRDVECEPRPRFMRMTAGNAHTCAVAEDRRDIYCWGTNAYGVLGEGGAGMQRSPVPVLAYRMDADVVEIVSGANHVCVLDVDGFVSCWGANDSRQLGHQDPNSTSRIRVDLPGNEITDIASGSDHTCVIATQTVGANTDKFVTCWGHNELGQIPGANNSQVGPTVVKLAGVPLTADHIESGPAANFVCWARPDTSGVGDDVGCFGAVPTSFELGDFGSLEGTSMPVVSMGASSEQVLYYESGEVFVSYAGTGAVTVTPAIDVNGYSVSKLAAGRNFFCGRFIAATGAHTIRCIGDDGNGQLGNAAGGPSAQAFVDALIDPGPQGGLAVGHAHACALGEDSHGRCWGRNVDGQLGTGDTNGSDVPVQVAAPATR